MSNYINSLNAQSRYDSMAIRSTYTGFNTAKLSYGTTRVSSGSGSYVNQSGVQYLGGIQAAASSMQKSLNHLSDASSYQRMQAVSSSPQHLTVSSGSKFSNEWTSSSVTISRLAAGQENQSDGLKASDRYVGETGYQQFELETDGRKRQLFVEVQAGDTNKTVQEKISSAINSAKMGISASVSTSGGTSTLTVRSNHTGDKDSNRFTLRDVSGSLVKTTGANQIAQQAQDAAYAVDGGPQQTSSSNEVSLGNGITATLRKETDGQAVTLSKSRDTNSIKEQVSQLAKDFNTLFEAGKSYASSNSRLLGDLSETFSTYQKSLESIGISLGKNGLTVDEKKLNTAIEDGSLANVMTDYGRGGGTYGFTGRLSAISTGLRFNTGAYADRSQEASDSLQESNSASYDWAAQLDAAALSANSKMDWSAYSNYMSLGYFVNMMI